MDPHSEPVHRPVMLAETSRLIAPSPGETLVDGTVGAGGHAAAILERLSGRGLLVGVDRDPEILVLARQRLEAVGGPFRLVRGRFGDLGRLLGEAGLPAQESIDGLLLDLGVSSLQLDRPERGFGFRHDGPLDMRMDPSRGESAAQWLRRADPSEIEETLRRYGEEKAARRIARAIERHRRRAPLERTSQLADLVESVLPRRGARIHPATRTFQALRLQVNGELEELEKVLRDADRYLRRLGRLVVLSYHSLEDRLVKRILGERSKAGLFRPMAGGLLRPSAEEVRSNPRARSARLRGYVRE